MFIKYYVRFIGLHAFTWKRMTCNSMQSIRKSNWHDSTFESPITVFLESSRTNHCTTVTKILMDNYGLRNQNLAWCIKIYIFSRCFCPNWHLTTLQHAARTGNQMTDLHFTNCDAAAVMYHRHTHADNKTKILVINKLTMLQTWWCSQLWQNKFLAPPNRTPAV